MPELLAGCFRPYCHADTLESAVQGIGCDRAAFKHSDGEERCCALRYLRLIEPLPVAANTGKEVPQVLHMLVGTFLSWAT